MERHQFSSTISVNGRPIGHGHPVFVVAEAGVAHFGSVKKAFRLVDLAAECGADAVKFQVFRVDSLISGASADWQERMRPKELPYDDYREVAAYCREKGILFFATAHDEESLDFLGGLDVPLFKVGSGEVGNWPFLKDIASRGKPVILSTGMYTLEEVGAALEAMAETGNRDLAVLHCVTQYPTPPAEINLKAMGTIRGAYGVMVGYSDHTEGFHVPLAAVARGACILEKHISLDFEVPDAQDWKVSCGPDNLGEMVRQIREIESALGTGVKQPGDAEAVNRDWARKSLVAQEDITPGTQIAAEHLCSKRPGTGIPPSEIDRVIGRNVRSPIKKDTLIQWGHLK